MKNESDSPHQSKGQAPGGQWSSRLQRLHIDRGRPGKGFVHLLGTNTIFPFLDLLPDREEITEGLKMIMLVPKVEDTYGLAHPGVIEICAWPRDLWLDLGVLDFEKEKWLLDKIEVPYTVNEKENSVVCEFTEKTARAHQLLGTFLHELGHHHHLIQNLNRKKKPPTRPVVWDGPYGRNMADRIFNSYADTFGL